MRLKILSWNCRSIFNKKDQLDFYLNSLPFEQTIHILLLQETWLNPKANFHLKNYCCLRRDRTNNKNDNYSFGGVMIMIHESLLFSSTKINLEIVENILIQLNIGSFKVTIGSIYSSSSISRKQAKSDITKLLSHPAPYIFAGDWNAKHSSWGNLNSTNKGVDLDQI